MNQKNNRGELIGKLKRAVHLNDNIGIKLDEIIWTITEGGMTWEDPPRRDTRPFKKAHKLHISFEADGTASVTVNDLLPFQVPPVSGALLHILAMDTANTAAHRADDPLVPFKSYDEIISNMNKMLRNRKFTKNALRQGIHRLRKMLAFHGFDGLLQTNRQERAYRLAVRRKNNSTRADSP